MTLYLQQIHSPPQRLDCRALQPTALHDRPLAELAAMTLRAGRRQYRLDELFRIRADDDGEPGLHLSTLDGRCDLIGAGMTAGRLQVNGDAGDAIAQGMQGGQLTVTGDCGDLAGSGLVDGTLRIHGQAGDGVGAPPGGQRQGQRGGLIHISGPCGERAGEAMRRGVLLIEGHCGRLLGHRMIAGTIVVGGQAGAWPGYGMRRGTIVLTRAPETLPPTLQSNGRLYLSFLSLLIDQLNTGAGKDLGLQQPAGGVLRWLGDAACHGQGELLILEKST